MHPLLNTPLELLAKGELLALESFDVPDGEIVVFGGSATADRDSYVLDILAKNESSEEGVLWHDIEGIVPIDIDRLVALGAIARTVDPFGESRLRLRVVSDVYSTPSPDP